jgi:hypothetical protein
MPGESGTQPEALPGMPAEGASAPSGEAAAEAAADEEQKKIDDLFKESK